MRRVLHLAIHDTKLFMFTKESIFFMLIMPVMFMLFFSVVLGGGGGGDPETVTVSLSVVNEDPDFMATAYLQQLEAESFMIQNYTAAEADTTEFIRMLRIPADFTPRILNGEQVELEFTKNADSNIQFDAAADVRLHKAQVAFLGNLIRWTPFVSDDEGKIRVLTDAEKGRLFAMIGEEKRVTVESGYAGRGRPVPSGAAQSIPGMLAMFVVMTLLIGGSESLTKEKYSGTLARLATTTFSKGEILGGKLLHLTFVGIGQAIVLMLAGQLIGEIGLFGIEFSWGPNAWAVVLLCIPYALAIGSLTLFISGLFRTTQQAESLGWLIGMVMAALGGCWWPAEVMPQSALVLAHIFPTYWAMEGFHALITFGRGVEAIVVPSLVLLVFGVIFGWLGVRTMRVVT